MSTAPLDPETVRAFVAAGHADLPRVRALLAENPALRDVEHPWAPGDTETALGAASHVGNRAIAEFLLAEGAPLTISAAAMLGRTADVERLLEEEPSRIAERGAHGIPLLAHAALSGDVDLVALLHGRGAREGVSFALHNAARSGDADIVRYFMEHDAPDLGWTDFAGKTAAEVAAAGGHDAVLALLGSA